MAEASKALSSLDIEKQKEYMRRICELNLAYKRERSASRRAFILTLGCQQNEADSERLMGMALEMGYEKTDTPEDASLIMVNTCAIREHAESVRFPWLGSISILRLKIRSL